MSNKHSFRYRQRVRVAQRVLDFIIDYKTQHDGNSPTFREIASGCGFHTTSSIRIALNFLQDHGQIYYEERQTRAIQVVGGKWIFEGK